MTVKKADVKKKRKENPNGNKPKAIYFTGEMAKDLRRIRRIRTDTRISDSMLIADAMKHFAGHLEEIGK